MDKYRLLSGVPWAAGLEAAEESNSWNHWILIFLGLSGGSSKGWEVGRHRGAIQLEGNGGEVATMAWEERLGRRRHRGI